MAGRSKVAEGIKVDNQVQEIILDYLSGPVYSQRPLKVKRKTGKSESSYATGFEDGERGY